MPGIDRDTLERLAGETQQMLLELPARVLPGLPIETRFYLHLLRVTDEVVLTTAKIQAGKEAELGLIFDGLELAALVTASESGRVLPQDLVRFCQQKSDDPEFRVDATVALAGAQSQTCPAWSLGRLLRSWNAELVAVDLVLRRRRAAQVSQAA